MASHVYEQDGEFVVRLIARALSGGSVVAEASAAMTLTVENAAPVVDPRSPATIDEGDEFSLSLAFSDAGVGGPPPRVDRLGGRCRRVLAWSNKA